MATEALSIREPNISHVKLVQIENTQKLLVAICKLIVEDSPSGGADNLSEEDSLLAQSINTSNSNAGKLHINPQATQSNTSLNSNLITNTKYNISFVNVFSGECLREIVFNGDILEIKSNADLFCINSWNRIDAFDLNTFEHRFSLNTCYSQVSKSTGKQINPFALGHRWIAFADNKVKYY